eukprot:1146924-Pelagomonas_calceolata.AAC.1
MGCCVLIRSVQLSRYSIATLALHNIENGGCVLNRAVQTNECLLFYRLHLHQVAPSSKKEGVKKPKQCIPYKLTENYTCVSAPKWDVVYRSDQCNLSSYSIATLASSFSSSCTNIEKGGCLLKRKKEKLRKWLTPQASRKGRPPPPQGLELGTPSRLDEDQYLTQLRILTNRSPIHPSGLLAFTQQSSANHSTCTITKLAILLL